ncbi:hypothetical protein HK405_005008 [Cladochytrium tenue]|nr:hypothetical protein HK405_005008 [Cladochytrium tenue]
MHINVHVDGPATRQILLTKTDIDIVAMPPPPAPTARRVSIALQHQHQTLPLRPTAHPASSSQEAPGAAPPRPAVASRGPSVASNTTARGQSVAATDAAAEVLAGMASVALERDGSGKLPAPTRSLGEAGGPSRKQVLSVMSESSARKQPPALNMISIGNRRMDLNSLKLEAFAHSTIRITRNLSRILHARKFDAFVVAAAHYCVWHVRALHLLRLRAAGTSTAAAAALDAAAASATGPGAAAAAAATAAAGRTLLFAPDEPTRSAEECAAERDARMGVFGKAYCFLLLHVSRHSAEPAKERAYFENIYAFTLRIVLALISAPPYAKHIEAELSRLFRSHLFCGAGAGPASPGDETAVPSAAPGTAARRDWPPPPTGANGVATASVATPAGASTSISLRESWLPGPGSASASRRPTPGPSTSARTASGRPDRPTPTPAWAVPSPTDRASVAGSARRRRSAAASAQRRTVAPAASAIAARRPSLPTADGGDDDDPAADATAADAADDGDAADAVAADGAGEPDAEAALLDAANGTALLAAEGGGRRGASGPPTGGWSARAAAARAAKLKRIKRISLNDVRTARSPLAEAVVVLSRSRRALF